MTPSINRMIKLLTDDERNQGVDKQRVILMEGEILKAFAFDFSFISPLPFLERFMRLSDLHIEEGVTSLCVELLKLSSIQIRFLEHRPSHIAAAAFVLALNISFNQANN